MDRRKHMGTNVTKNLQAKWQWSRFYLSVRQVAVS
jgi:hypothetical protein